MDKKRLLRLEKYGCANLTKEELLNEFEMETEDKANINLFDLFYFAISVSDTALPKIKSFCKVSHNGKKYNLYLERI